MRDLPAPESPSWAISFDDLPWVLSLAHRRYTHTPDPGTTLAWLARIIQSPDVASAIRSDGAFCVATLNVPPWWPDERECHVSVLVADKGCHWQAISLLRETIQWARVRGCVRWYLSSETDVDFGLLAQRVGCTFQVVKYGIDLME